MGLDIMHFKLTTDIESADDYLFLEDWDLDCNVPQSEFKKYITKVKDSEITHGVLIVSNNFELQELQKDEFCSVESYDKIFFGDLNDTLVQQEISVFIKENNLSIDDISALDVTTNKITYTTVSFLKEIMVKGMYYKEVGYQNKGMNALFYKTFRKMSFWGKKEDFELAFNCIENDGIYDDWYVETQAHFKANFLDKFEYGKSLLCTSF